MARELFIKPDLSEKTLVTDTKLDLEKSSSKAGLSETMVDKHGLTILISFRLIEILWDSSQSR